MAIVKYLTINERLIIIIKSKTFPPLEIMHNLESWNYLGVGWLMWTVRWNTNMTWDMLNITIVYFALMKIKDYESVFRQ